MMINVALYRNDSIPSQELNLSYLSLKNIKTCLNSIKIYSIPLSNHNLHKTDNSVQKTECSRSALVVHTQNKNNSLHRTFTQY